MATVSPTVAALWRLIRLLQKEEEEDTEITWYTNYSTLCDKAYISPRSPRPGVNNAGYNSGSGYNGNDKNAREETVNGDVNGPAHHTASCQVSGSSLGRQSRGRSRERRTNENRREVSDAVEANEMVINKKSDGAENNNCLAGKDDRENGNRGSIAAKILARRKPSPKRSAAPTPPCPRSCPSPAPKPVSTSDVSPADVEGWLVDQLRGRRVWCVLSDMLFCVFERPDAPTSKQVLLLPGCSVRVLEFKSAHLEKRRLLHGASASCGTNIKERQTSSVSSSSASSVASTGNKYLHQNCNGTGGDVQGRSVSVSSDNSSRSVSSDYVQISSEGSISLASANKASSVIKGRTSSSSVSSSHSVFSNTNTISSLINNNTDGEIGSRANSKTVSGVDRFQFVIENSVTRQKHMFAVSSRSELGLWTEALNKACSLDITSKDTTPTAEISPKKNKIANSNHREDGTVTTDDIILTQATLSKKPDHAGTSVSKDTGSISNSRSTTISNDESISLTYSPCQTLPSRIDVHSLSLSLTQPHDVSKETVDEIRRKLKKDNPDTIEYKHIPMKATLDLDETVTKSPRGVSSTNTTPRNGESPRKSRTFFKGRSPLDVLLGRKKRSSSADDAYRNRKLFPVYNRDEDSLSNPSFSPRAPVTGSQHSLESSHSSQSHSRTLHDSSFSNSSVDSRESSGKHRNHKPKRGGGVLAKSWDAEKSPRGLSSSLRRTASDLKDRVFGSGGTLATKSSHPTKPAGLKLKDLMEARVSGTLHYRVAYKFVKVFCVLSKGCFYAFKSEKPEESPLLAMVLAPCSVTYVVESELDLHRYSGSGRKKTKQHHRLYAFKLSQPHCRSIYACAESHETLLQWMMSLQAEASRVQVDEALAAEIREKPSSLKKKHAKEMSANSRNHVQDVHLSLKDKPKPPDKRHSCPSFDEKYFKSISANTKSSGMANSSSSVANRCSLESLTAENQHDKTSESRLLYNQPTSHIYRSKSDRDVELSRVKAPYLENQGIGSASARINGLVSLTRVQNSSSSALSKTEDIASRSGGGFGFGDSSLFVFQTRDDQSVNNHLRLDLSCLTNDTNNADASHDVIGVGSTNTQHSQKAMGYPDSQGAERTSNNNNVIPTMRKQWKTTSVKRASSLNTPSSTSTTSSSPPLISSLLPSKSKVLDDISLRTSSSSNSKKTISPRLTSFFSQLANKDKKSQSGKRDSPSSDIYGYRLISNRHSDNNSEHADLTHSNDLESDIVSPPLPFRTPEGQTAFDSDLESHSHREERTEQPVLAMPPTSDQAVREVWSRNEDFLLGVIRDKLRRRRQREPEGEEPAIVQNGPSLESQAPIFVYDSAHQPIAMDEGPNLKDQMTGDGHGSVDEEEEEEEAGQSDQNYKTKSSLELRHENGEWKRTWCVLTGSRLLVFSSESDREPMEVTDLAGYDVTELIDQFPGKRFVLRLERKKLPLLMLSLDSRAELVQWKHRISICTRGLHLEASLKEPGLGDDHQVSAAGGSASGELHRRTNSSSAQSVKQRLLAEMLRQRLELERMQAMRAEMRASQQQAQGDALALDEDRIVALTRLKQRRMSTQIKLQTIQRQMEAVHGLSPREKRSTFLALGRKRAPDLLLQAQIAKDGSITSEHHGEDGRTALEAQVKTLSSRLQNLDENISSHEATSSPREDTISSVMLRNKHPGSSSLVRTNYELLRHSLDPSYLSSSDTEQSTSLRDSVFAEDSNELSPPGVMYQTSQGFSDMGSFGNDGDKSLKPGSKDKESVVSKSTSTSFKSSVQKLAHRTFSRATNWNWASKKSPPASSSSTSIPSPPGSKDESFNNNNNTIPLSFSSGQLSDLTPDVIDMTTKSSNRTDIDTVFPTDRYQQILDDNAVLNSPHEFDMTGSLSLSATSPQGRQGKHKSPSEKLISKVAVSSPMSVSDRFNSRLQGFSSSSPNLAANDGSGSIRKFMISQETEFFKASGSTGTEGRGFSKHLRPSSLGLPNGTAASGGAVPSPSFTASSTRQATASEPGAPITPRREVNPDALAQIEAFEELSLKFLGASAK